MRQRKTRRTAASRRQSRSIVKPLSILFLLLVLCASAYWQQRGEESGGDAGTKMEQIEDRRDDGRDADYTEASQEIHDAVAAWLKAQGADCSDIKTEDRTEPRRATGGTIRWTTKSTAVIPQKPFSRDALETVLQKSGGKAVLYRTEQTTRNGKAVTEYDIAYFDMLDTEQVYLVTDRLYVMAPQEKKTVADEVKSLILNSPSGSLKDAESAAQFPSGDTAKEAEKQVRPAQVKGRLAIVIDDCGSSLDILREFNAIPVPLTYAVMPDKPYTAASARSGYQAGRKIFVHMPMQPLNTSSSEAIFIGEDMSDSKVKATAAAILDQVPHAVGMNNHQGSLATADARLMKDVMAVLKQRGLVYLDSRTNSASVGDQTAASMGVATSRNNLFIDNDADVASVKARLRQGGQIALSNGSAVVIGHCRHNTAQAVRDMVQELAQEGVEIVFVTDLMQ